MKKIVFLFLLSVGNLTLSNAQNVNPNKALPQNKKIIKGVLDNGLTYYIYKTDVNKNTASYYIIQNVGSILEDDQQKGLAHFLEHMAFNGTKNFGGKGILNTLQKHGAVFGKNINAYTGFDETVYNLNTIPTNVPGLMDTCLLVLHDWSHDLLLTDEEIDAERGVITEEWRTTQDANQRIFNQLSPVIFNNSLYARHMPIGDMNIVKNFEYKEIRDFYRDWYRTDLQAIAVIGDVDTAEVEQKIKSLFSTIPVVQNPKKRFEVTIPDNQQPLFKLALDKEISNSIVSFKIKQKTVGKSETFADLQKDIQRNIAFSILNKRLNELAQNENNPFKNADASYSNYVRTSDFLDISLFPKPNQQAAAFTLVMNEWIRAIKFGFSEGEIQRALAETVSDYENYIEKEREISHQDIARMIKKNYLNHQFITDPKGEFEIIKELLKSITTKNLQESLSESYTIENRKICVTGVENEKNLDEKETLSIISMAESNHELKPHVDTFAGKSLLSNIEITPGKIISEKKDAVINATTFKLSNGVKVHYKYADKNKNDVQLLAESYGGSSLYDPADIPSARMATNLATMSGLGMFSTIDLDKVLTGKKANSSVAIQNLSESVSGSANAKDIETMMQLVYLRFVKPRFDIEIFNILKTDMQNNLKNRDKEIKSIIRDSITASLYGKNNPKVRMMNQQYIDDLSFEKMKKVYLERFKDVSNFEFYIIGDIDIEVLKPLMEHYIASIASQKRTENFRDNTVPWISDKIDKDIFIKMETPKSVVRIHFEKTLKYNQKNAVMANMLADILKLRYTESLREKEGGTYGAHVNGNLNRLPKSNYSLAIGFDCDANKVEHLLSIVYQEIEKLKKGEYVKEDIEKTKTSYLKGREDSKGYNKYSMNLTLEYFKNKINIDDPKNFTAIIKSINEDDLQNFAKVFFNKAKSHEFVFKPI